MDDGELTSYAWCARTGGALTAAQRRHLVAATLRTYGDHGVGLARLATGRRDERPVRLPTAPDSGVVALAIEAARDQGPDLEGHGLRTWLFGGALADRDGVALDPELFCVAAIVHDAGAARPVAGQDFTVRSADAAARALAAHGLGEDAPALHAVRDGIVAHATAGLDAGQSPIGFYVQAGAMLDITGLRLADLPVGVVDEVYRRHPAGGIRDTILRLVREEARAVPTGRFALLRRLGLALAVRTTPSLRGR